MINLKDGRARLKEVCLEITEACPMNCLHCSGECDANSRNMLSLHQIKKVISEFSGMGGEILEISGGEPLLHPFLPQIVDYAEKNNLGTILYTSGIMWNTIRGITSLDRNLAAKLRLSGLGKVIFSLQGAASSTHEAVTQVRGSFNNVVCAIKIMKSLGFWVGVHFVPMKLNYGEFRDMYQLCQDLEIDEVGVLRLVPQGRGRINKGILELSKSEFEEFNSVLKELTSKCSNPIIRVGRPMDFRFVFDPSFVKSECDAGISRCLIAPDGKVVPCPAFKQNNNDRYVAGNVKDNSLVDIWNKSSKWRDFRHFDYSQLGEPCKSCEHLRQCRGGCRAQRFLKYNDMYVVPDPCCFKCATPLAAICPSSAKVQERLLSVQI